jgi:hypothetical protein
VTIALPDAPMPRAYETAAIELRARIAPRLGEEDRARLVTAVRAFEVAGKKARLAAWATGVERTATRAGFLMCGDLDVAARMLAKDVTGLVEPDDKIADLAGFVVSEEHHALREELGIAIEP